jgi:hypothetical protein
MSGVDCFVPRLKVDAIKMATALERAAAFDEPVHYRRT